MRPLRTSDTNEATALLRTMILTPLAGKKAEDGLRTVRQWWSHAPPRYLFRFLKPGSPRRIERLW